MERSREIEGRRTMAETLTLESIEAMEDDELCAAIAPHMGWADLQPPDDRFPYYRGIPSDQFRSSLRSTPPATTKFSLPSWASSPGAAWNLIENLRQDPDMIERFTIAIGIPFNYNPADMFGRMQPRHIAVAYLQTVSGLDLSVPGVVV